MTDSSEFITSAQAAAYISERLQRPWDDPISSLGYLVMKDLIKPVDLPTSGNGQRVPARYFTRAECDRLIATYRKPGNQPRDLGPILDRLGKETDEALAAEIGCHPRTVARKRTALGIAKFKQQASRCTNL